VSDRFVTKRKTYASVLKKNSNQAQFETKSKTLAVKETQYPVQNQATRVKPIYGAKSTARSNTFSQKNFTKKKIFVSTHNVQTTKEYISNTVEQICGTPPFSCIQVKTRYNSYVSFCITVSEACYTPLLDPLQWEDDFLIMPFEGKRRYRQGNSQTMDRGQTARSHPNGDAHASSTAPVPNNEVAFAAPSSSKQHDNIADLKRQNKELEQQIKELQGAWDADNESILSSVSSAHNSKSVCSDHFSTNSAMNTERDLNLHLSLEEGTLANNHSTPEDEV